MTLSLGLLMLLIGMIGIIFATIITFIVVKYLK